MKRNVLIVASFGTGISSRRIFIEHMTRHSIIHAVSLAEHVPARFRIVAEILKEQELHRDRISKIVLSCPVIQSDTYEDLLLPTKSKATERPFVLYRGPRLPVPPVPSRYIRRARCQLRK